MLEREQKWKEIETQIKCPLTGDPCKKAEGIRRKEVFLSHSAIVITAECNFCGSQASGWGER